MNFLKTLFLGRLTAKQFAVRLIVLFALYAGSIGPMYWRWYESMYLSGPRWVARLYYPLLFVCILIPPFGDLIDWYIGLWVG